MSTNWGYKCMSHEPHIKSEHWFNHGDDLLIAIYILNKNGLWPKSDNQYWDEPKNIMVGNWETASAVSWLWQHPNCKVVLNNEYDENKNIPLQWKPETLREVYNEQIKDISLLVSLIVQLTE